MKSHTQQFVFITHIHQPVLIFSKSGAIVTWNTSMENIAPRLKEDPAASVSTVFKNPAMLYEKLQQLSGENTSAHIDGLVLSQNKQILSGTIALINHDYVCFIGEKLPPGEHYLNLFQSIIDAIPRQIIVIDAHGNIILTNKMWVEFINSILKTNYERAEYVQSNFFDFCNRMECFDDTFHSLLHSSIEKIFNNESEYISLENILYISGKAHWFRVNISRYTLNGSTYCMMMFNDITRQKEYQDQIQQQRDMFQKYLDISPYMIVILNEQGTIHLVNKKACEILGYEYNELIGRDWFALCVPKDMQDQVREVYFKLMQGQVKPVEFYENPVVTKDGSLRLIAWHNTILTNSEGTIIGTMSSGEDITHKKQMEIELLKSTTNLKAIVQAFPDLYVIAGRDGTIYDYQFGEEMKLYATREQVVGKQFYNLLPEHIAELYRNAVDEVFTKNTVVGIEYPIEIEGETHWREARLVPMLKDRVMAVIRDVTKRKEMELALAESERRYRHLVNRIPAAVVEMNVNGDIIFVNEYFQKLTGYTLENLKGTHWFRNILHPHEDKRKIRQFFEMIQNGDVNNYEIMIINKDGYDTHLTITTSNVYNVVGKLERIVCIAADITPIVVLRDKLKEMAIKDELTGLYNRRGFTMLAEQQLKLSKRSGKGIALFYVDMDNMKVINDTLGHHEGDKALIDVAGILRLSFRDSDIVGRLGGDEFAVFAIDCEKQYVDVMQNRIIDNINDFNEKKVRPYTLSLSIGSIYIGDSSINLEEVLAVADKRMYQNKLQQKKQRN